MILTKNYVNQFTKVFYSELNEIDQLQESQKFSERFNNFNDKQWVFYIHKPNNSLLSFHIQQDFATNYILFVTANRGFIDQDYFNDVFSKLSNEVIEFLSTKYKDFSLENKCIQDSLPSNAFEQSQFKLIYARHEFKKDLTNLSVEFQDKINFKSYKEWDLSLDQVAQIMTKSAYGDPAFSEDYNPLKFLQSLLNDSNFYSKDDCIQIGKIEYEFACIIIPQSKDIWGRLAYLGLLPKF
ncbi:MAG: hypothetical protein COB02_13080 [Candidatus Cloacimonadota bacterium]|nr:MAG: hypothetical protein COB02_13080 [Candidatus Cloacimonadota bacterium]